MSKTKATTDPDKAGSPAAEAAPPTAAAPVPNAGAGEASSPPLTPEELAGLKVRAAKADENWDRYLRAVAELDNFKKRAARERQEAARNASEALLQKLIPVLDHLDMALTAADRAANPVADSLKTGFMMVGSQLRSILAEAGLEEIEAAGQQFDPKCHEAVAHEDSADVAEGRVLQQMRKGYRLRDRLLRPATVVVARKPSVPAA
jgi:molecular chaperone GrpE